jgi:hypothetical protein
VTNLATALRLAHAGLYVIPCDPTTKAPRLPGWTTRATNKPEGVRYYWEKYGSDCMPGVALGLCGLVAIDVDVKNGIDGCAALDPLLDTNGGFPPCPVTITPSRGRHVILGQQKGRAPLGNRTGALPRGIDIRGVGGQVIAPGAIRSDGTFYESMPGWPDLAEAFAADTIPEIPGWLVEIIEARPAVRDCGPSLNSEPRTVATGNKTAWVAEGLSQEAHALAATPENGRNNGLNRLVYTFAGHAANGWTTREEIYEAVQWACAMNGYLASRDPSDGPKKFEKTFNSAWRSGFGKPTAGPRERLTAYDPNFTAGLKPRGA